LRYFAKSVVLEKKNTMPGKVDNPLQTGHSGAKQGETKQ